ncbi:hypothetical protein NDU88_003463 [Pleurodeles waltl]|uniref:Uncharacterized protein n=1 Tax=Pleurodeles waltl TaxID=8319 RepID=A0AAV7W631_PLEWA|nr:hypothetical protein NDU88_003463 [Pleurodeles waltl]
MRARETGLLRGSGPLAPLNLERAPALRDARLETGLLRGGTFGPIELQTRARFAGRASGDRLAAGAGPLALLNFKHAPASLGPPSEACRPGGPSARVPNIQVQHSSTRGEPESKVSYSISDQCSSQVVRILLVSVSWVDNKRKGRATTSRGQACF